MLIEVRLFGALKRFGRDGILELEISGQLCAGQIRKLISDRLSVDFPHDSAPELVARAALACDNRVLQSEEPVVLPCALALLPPVCGG